MQWWLAQAAALLGLEDYLLRRPGQPLHAQVPSAVHAPRSTSDTTQYGGDPCTCLSVTSHAAAGHSVEVVCITLQAQQVVLPGLEGGLGGGELGQGVGERVHGAQGSGLEGKLVLLLGMLVVPMIAVITAGLLLPVHTGGCSHVVASASYAISIAVHPEYP